MKKIFLSMMLVMASVVMFAQCNFNETETINVGDFSDGDESGKAAK